MKTFLLVILALYLAGPWLAPQDPLEQHRDQPNAAPSKEHIFGTDDFGRDIFSRFLAGGASSIALGAAATALTLTLGWTLGALAGLGAGLSRIDFAISRLIELLLTLPWLYVLIALRTLIPLKTPPRTVSGVLLLAIACISWARPARLVRGLILSVKERGYVHAARQFHVPEWKIFVDHILPATYGLLATQALVLFPRFVLAEVTLSFLGLGSGEPDPTWGALILNLKHAYLIGEQWWRILPPLLMLPLFVTCAIASRVAARRLLPSR